MLSQIWGGLVLILFIDQNDVCYPNVRYKRNHLFINIDIVDNQ